MKIYGEYKKEANIHYKMRLDKGNAYTAKETLGYMGQKFLYFSCEKGKKRSKCTNKYPELSKEPRDEQNRINEELRQ